MIEGSDDQPPPESDGWEAEQWMQWIAEHPEPDDGDRPSTGRRGRSSIGSQMLAGAMLGLRDVLYGPVDDEAAVVQSLDEPDDDDALIKVFLDPDDPAASYALIRDAASDEGP